MPELVVFTLGARPPGAVVVRGVVASSTLLSPPSSLCLVVAPAGLRTPSSAVVTGSADVVKDDVGCTGNSVEISAGDDVNDRVEVAVGGGLVSPIVVVGAKVITGLFVVAAETEAWPQKSIATNTIAGTGTGVRIGTRRFITSAFFLPPKRICQFQKYVRPFEVGGGWRTERGSVLVYTVLRKR